MSHSQATILQRDKGLVVLDIVMVATASKLSDEKRALARLCQDDLDLLRSSKHLMTPIALASGKNP
jgi:hypothetical protein